MADFESLDEIIRKACSFNPEDRYETVQQLLKELNNEVKEQAIPAHKASVRKSRWNIALPFLLFASLLVYAGVKTPDMLAWMQNQRVQSYQQRITVLHNLADTGKYVEADKLADRLVVGLSHEGFQASSQMLAAVRNLDSEVINPAVKKLDFEQRKKELERYNREHESKADPSNQKYISAERNESYASDFSRRIKQIKTIAMNGGNKEFASQVSNQVQEQLMRAPLDVQQKYLPALVNFCKIYNMPVLQSAEKAYACLQQKSATAQGKNSAQGLEKIIAATPSATPVASAASDSFTPQQQPPPGETLSARSAYYSESIKKVIRLESEGRGSDARQLSEELQKELSKEPVLLQEKYLHVLVNFSKSHKLDLMPQKQAVKPLEAFYEYNPSGHGLIPGAGIYLRFSDGSKKLVLEENLSRVGVSMGHYSSSIALSPNKRRVVFAEGESDGSYAHLFLVNTNATGLKTVTPVEKGVKHIEPTWIDEDTVRFKKLYTITGQFEYWLFDLDKHNDSFNLRKYEKQIFEKPSGQKPSLENLVKAAPNAKVSGTKSTPDAPKQIQVAAVKPTFRKKQDYLPPHPAVSLPTDGNSSATTADIAYFINNANDSEKNQFYGWWHGIRTQPISEEEIDSYFKDGVKSKLTINRLNTANHTFYLANLYNDNSKIKVVINERNYNTFLEIQRQIVRFCQEHKKSKELKSKKLVTMHRPAAAMETATTTTLDDRVKNHVLQGDMYYSRKDYASALEEYNKAILLNPRRADAYNGIGNVYWAQGKGKEAFDAYDLAIKFDQRYQRAKRWRETHPPLP